MRLYPRIKFKEKVGIYDPEKRKTTIVNSIDLSLISIKTNFFDLKSKNVLIKLRLNNKDYNLKAKILVKKEKEYIVFLFVDNFSNIAASIGKYIEQQIFNKKKCPYCFSNNISDLECKNCKMPLNFSTPKLLEKLSKIKLRDLILDHLNDSYDITDPKNINLDFIDENVKNLIKKFALTDFPVLIVGETGTGKTFIAKLIHLYSSRKNENFVHINCANIPNELFESEIFGYEKGAFTGASKKKEGLIVKADKGTLFLDEIGELPITIQTKLLKLLDDKTYYPLGSNEERKVNIRLVSATNQNLEEAIDKKIFRKDLYYRINTLKIELKPLRERKDFIIKIAQTILNNYREKLNRKNLKFERDTIDFMLQYDWPGNIRELENVIKRAVVIAESDYISKEDLMIEIDKKNANYTFPKNITKEILQEKYNQTNGNISEISRLLGVSRPTVYKLLKKYNIT